jgi:diguanylate cyclase (GGDEF)-like protein
MMVLPQLSIAAMGGSYCERFGFDEAKIAERLSLTGLWRPENHSLADILHTRVIEPHIDAIVDRFYEKLGRVPEFIEVVRRHSQFEKLKMTQRAYLLDLGLGFDTPEYFEERLRVGATHERVGVSLTIYQCAYRLLQSLLIDHIPNDLKSMPDDYDALVQFVLRITALDMSLAIETYFTAKLVSLEESIDSMRDESRSLRKSLETDTLTRLHSRAYSIEVLKRALTESQQTHCPLSVVMADLDHFKSINDSHGHLVGDRVLQAVASRMINGSRDSDTFGRYGGEEFILILENTPLAGARVVAERIRHKIGADPVSVNNLSLPVTLSMGAAEARQGDTAESLASRADHALYDAKSAGRNRVCLETGETEAVV